MKLRKVHDTLGSLHLTSLALSNEGAGLQKISYPLVNAAINHALLDIHTTFDVGVDELILRVIGGKLLYSLEAKYADSNTDVTVPQRWIVDSAEKPFTGDVKYIKSIFTQLGEKLPLNDNNTCNGVFTPSPTLIQLTNTSLNDNEYLSVIYATNPQEIPLTTDLDVDTFEIKLPANMFNLLVLGACKYIFQSKSGKDMYYKGVQYEQKYEAEKIKLNSLGFLNEAFQENEHFSSGGWV